MAVLFLDATGGRWTKYWQVLLCCRQSMNAGQCSAQAGAGRLQELQASGLQLTTRSLQLLSLSDPKEQQAFAATSREEADSSLSFITCMAVIRQAADEVRVGPACRCRCLCPQQ